MSSAVADLLQRHVEAGTAPGAVAVVGRADREPEVVAVGAASVGGPPMRPDALIRIQSMTRAITSVAALQLVEAGLGLDDGVEGWLPELASRTVLTSPTAELDDTVPADRSITLRAPADQHLRLRDDPGRLAVAAGDDRQRHRGGP